jgi:hypothetical protein
MSRIRAMKIDYVQGGNMEDLQFLSIGIERPIYKISVPKAVDIC